VQTHGGNTRASAPNGYPPPIKRIGEELAAQPIAIVTRGQLMGPGVIGGPPGVPSTDTPTLAQQVGSKNRGLKLKRLGPGAGRLRLARYRSARSKNCVDLSAEAAQHVRASAARASAKARHRLSGKGHVAQRLLGLTAWHPEGDQRIRGVGKGLLVEGLAAIRVDDFKPMADSSAVSITRAPTFRAASGWC